MRYHIYGSLLALSLAACQAAPGTANVPSKAPGPLYRVQATDEAAVTAGAADRVRLGVTVYNDDRGLVSDVRRVSLPAGTVTLRFADVPSKIDGASVALRGADGLKVLEQTYAFDVITPEKLLAQFIGREVQIRMPAEGDQPARLVTAKLLSTNGGYVYEIDGKVHIQPPGEVILPSLPEGMSTKPMLEWRLSGASAAPRELEAQYQTGGLNWQASYSLNLAGEASEGELSGWATITNKSGVDYPDAALTLVAGDVNRATPTAVPAPRAYVGEGAKAEAGDGFAQGNMGEYHRYDLERPATIGNDETKQLQLMAPSALPLTREFVFDTQRYAIATDADPNQPVQTRLRFTNQLKRPLPGGTVRIYQEDAKGGRQLLGEDTLRHTPEGAQVTLTVGNAFDLTGKRVQTGQEQLGTNSREESWRVTLHNAKDQPASVVVIERPFGDWKVVKSSQAYEKVSTNELRFVITVPAKGQAEVTYTLRYGS